MQHRSLTLPTPASPFPWNYVATSGTESAFRVWLVSLLINKCYFCVNMIWLFMTTRKPLKLTLHHPIPGDPGRSTALRSNKNVSKGV